MKVKVTFTVEVDAKRWAEDEGLLPSEVRADVIDYLLTEVIASSAIVSTGTLKVVTRP